MTQRGEPYAIAYVTLEEGPTMLTNLIDCDFDKLAVGQAVKVKFVDTGEGAAVFLWWGEKFGGAAGCWVEPAELCTTLEAVAPLASSMHPGRSLNGQFDICSTLFFIKTIPGLDH